MSGLVSLGHRVVDHLVGEPAASSATAANSPSFSAYMSRGGTLPTSELSNYLSAKGVDTWQELSNMQFHLGQALNNHPQLRGLRESLSGLSQLTLSAETEGLFTVRNQQGQSYTFSKDSELGQLAQRFQQISSMQSMHQRFAGESVAAMAELVTHQPLTTPSSWLIA